MIPVLRGNRATARDGSITNSMESRILIPDSQILFLENRATSSSEPHEQIDPKIHVINL